MLGSQHVDPNASVFTHIAECSTCRIALASVVRAKRPSTLERTKAESIESLARGQYIGPYELIRCIGIGGAGVVWEAHQDAQPFALKVLRHSSSHHVRRFRREARIATKLDHPNVLPLREVIDDVHLGPVLVMPFLRGETLENVLVRERRWSVSRAASFLLPVLDALGYAHSRGVVHRDLKPQNIFVDGDVIRILDFGIAKLLADSAVEGSKITRTGELLGTPRYMAPEQIFGDDDIDARVDVWATGVIAYRALSGQLPIVARTMGEIIKAHARGIITPLDVHAPNIPVTVVAAVMHSLERDRSKRAASVGALRSALEVCR